MALATLTCPHCGYSRSQEEFFLPREGTEMTCADCQKGYIFMETQVFVESPDSRTQYIPNFACTEFSEGKSTSTFEFIHGSSPLGEPINQKEKSVENKPRKLWVAGLLSLIQPGLGQLYNGEIGKAIFVYFVPILLVTGLIIFMHSHFLRLYLAVFTLLGTVSYVLFFVDAIRTAKRYSISYTPKKYNETIIFTTLCVLVVVASLTIHTMIKHNIVKAYRLPSKSMEPTLLIGDDIYADRRQSARNPQRGDLIVFEFPGDPTKEFIKRVVAVGGDTVEIRNKILIVNDKIVKESYVVHNEEELIPASENPRDNFGPQMVPENSYFVLGDNRDRSFDSRFWGSVDKSKIKGTVLCIYWSWDQKMHSVRWDRVGNRVQ